MKHVFQKFQLCTTIYDSVKLLIPFCLTWWFCSQKFYKCQAEVVEGKIHILHSQRNLLWNPDLISTCCFPLDQFSLEILVLSSKQFGPCWFSWVPWNPFSLVESIVLLKQRNKAPGQNKIEKAKGKSRQTNKQKKTWRIFLSCDFITSCTKEHKLSSHEMRKLWGQFVFFFLSFYLISIIVFLF